MVVILYQSQNPMTCFDRFITSAYSVDLRYLRTVICVGMKVDGHFCTISTLITNVINL
jgi:hypothetical protein